MGNAEELRPAGLEGFELWDRTVGAPEHKEVKVAFVSLRVGGVIGLNRAAYRMWGEPDACQVLFDPERRRIDLRPANPNEPNSYELSVQGGVAIPCKSIFDYYGVEIKHSRRYHDPKVVDGVLVVDL
jgi:hypothetical protein